MKKTKGKCDEKKPPTTKTTIFNLDMMQISNLKSKIHERRIAVLPAFWFRYNSNELCNLKALCMRGKMKCLFLCDNNCHFYIDFPLYSPFKSAEFFFSFQRMMLHVLLRRLNQKTKNSNNTHISLSFGLIDSQFILFTMASIQCQQHLILLWVESVCGSI